ncbi:hypothetical protein G6F60_013587 [Rhizopus arrhizus]|nr:hypothetical protein G6F60_013587 [Rhizopus arrhizus]
MSRALLNLVQNAVRYASQRVEIELNATAGGYELLVDDDGGGIAEADRERVFDPFIRLDESRDRGTGGAGLGRTNARALAEKDGARLWLRNRAEGGLEAVVQWPASAQVVPPGRAG